MRREKAKLVDEARQTVGQIKQMERSLADYPEDDEGDDDEEVTLPLLKCVSALKERHKAVKRRHAERYDSVKSMSIPFLSVT